MAVAATSAFVLGWMDEADALGESLSCGSVPRGTVEVLQVAQQSVVREES